MSLELISLKNFQGFVVSQIKSFKSIFCLCNLFHCIFKVIVHCLRYNFPISWVKVIKKTLICWWTYCQKRFSIKLLNSIAQYMSWWMPKSILTEMVHRIWRHLQTTAFNQRPIKLNKIPLIILLIANSIKLQWNCKLSALYSCKHILI